MLKIAILKIKVFFSFNFVFQGVFNSWGQVEKKCVYWSIESAKSGKAKRT